MPPETSPKERTAAVQAPPVPRPEDDALRDRAVRRLERVRRFELFLAVYALSMLVLTPVRS